MINWPMIYQRLTSYSQKYKDCLSVLIIFFAGCYGIKQQINDLSKNNRTSFYFEQTNKDLDNVLIVDGIRDKEFTDTFSWWHGPWCGLVKFYRPLSSLFFWFEYKLFNQEYWKYMTIHLLSHFAFLGICYIFFQLLIEPRYALLATVFFGSAQLFCLLPSSKATLYNWKDSVDIWCSSAYLLSLITYIFSAQTTKTIIMRLFSYNFFIIALLFKEMAYTLPFAIILISWFRGEFKESKNGIVVYMLIAIAMFAFRTYCLQGRGYHLGSNRAWLYKTLLNLGGTPTILVITGSWMEFATTLVLFSIAYLIFFKNAQKQTKIILLSVMFVLFCSSLLLAIKTIGYTLIALVGYIFEIEWKIPLSATIFILMMLAIIKHELRAGIFAYLFAFIAYLPLISAPITNHALYLVSAGWSLWLAIGVKSLIQLEHTKRQSIVS